MPAHPLIYCNGDSYSTEKYHFSLQHKTYANYVAKIHNGFVINKARSGSCNRRIIRSSLHDLIHQRQLNPDQKIVALIGLTFELRSEIWTDSLIADYPEESNFITHVFSDHQDWKTRLLDSIDLDTPNRYNVNKKFLDHYSKGRAYFFSPYAERINLLADLIMFRAVCQSMNIAFVIFQSPLAEKLENDYLLDFFKKQLQDDLRIFDLERFSFLDWCTEKKFVPLDMHDQPNIAHYGPDAHEHFAVEVILPLIQKLNLL